MGRPCAPHTGAAPPHTGAAPPPTGAAPPTWAPETVALLQLQGKLLGGRGCGAPCGGVQGSGGAPQQRVAVFLPRPPPARRPPSGPLPRPACPHARPALGLRVEGWAAGHVSRTPQQTTAKLAAFPPRVPNQTGKRVGGRLLPHGPFCPTVSCPCTVLARLPGLPGIPTWPAFPSFQAASPNALHGERTAPTQTPGAASASDLLRDPDRDRELGAVLLGLGPCTRRSEAFGPDQGGRRHLGLLPWGGDPGDGAAPTEDGQSSACSAASGGRVLVASPARLPRRRQPPTQPPLRPPWRLLPAGHRMQPWFHRELATRVPSWDGAPGASRGHLRRPRPVPLHSTSAPLWPVGIYLVSGIRHCAAWVSWEENVTSTVYRSQLRVWVSSKPSLLPNPKGFLGTVETPRQGSPDARGPSELTAPPPLPPAAPTPAPSSSGIAESEPALPPQLRS